ncbi:YcjX family protein [Sagittula sp. NFXS13]|uniref:YcjX family protein n=1 Tax=Sagittula sp. NFXS13 TaxID=2819095 RepID=UPI0032DF16DF
MVLTSIADSLTRTVESAGNTISETFFEPTLRLGVTGLSRAGKTVFITSLVANLMDRGRMPGLVAQSEARILTAFLQPQPDDTLPRFDYETHLGALMGATPHWPDSTRAVSELRLSLKVRPSGLLSGLQGPRTLHLDIVDYPGEWLLDLGMMDKSYDAWSQAMLTRMAHRPDPDHFLPMATTDAATAKLDEPVAQRMAAAYTTALHAARAEGFSDCSPGRFLLPGDLAGSPVLTFAPLPPVDKPARGTLYREFERRFDAYKSRVIKPFFQDHFSRLDRQIVLVDALGAINAGPRAVEDLRQTLADILTAFRPGTSSFLSQIFLGKRIDKILFAATKADHLHHTQHGKLTAIMEALTRDARDRARFAGAETAAMSLAALRATTEEMISHQGTTLPCVRGTLMDSGKQAAFYPGDLPEDPNHLLSAARTGTDAWLDQDYSVMSFAPARLTLKPGEGPPHIRLDRAAQFLIGDRL